MTDQSAVPAGDGEYRLVIHQDGSDDFPWTTVECTFAPDDPERPCRVVECVECVEYGSPDCLADPEHDTHVAPGCGVKDWYDAAGSEGIKVIGLEVRVPVSVEWADDGWDLTALATPAEAPAPSPNFGAVVQDAGGGMVALLVDRDTWAYPEVGSHVEVVVAPAEAPGGDVEHKLYGPGNHHCTCGWEGDHGTTHLSDVRNAAPGGDVEGERVAGAEWEQAADDLLSQLIGSYQCMFCGHHGHHHAVDCPVYRLGRLVNIARGHQRRPSVATLPAPHPVAVSEAMVERAAEALRAEWADTDYPAGSIWIPPSELRRAARAALTTALSTDTDPLGENDGN